MSVLLDVASWVFILLGSFFCIVGGLAIVYFPDFYTRIHGASVTDSLGAGLLILGCVFQAGSSQVTLKLLLVLIFLLISSPTAAHALVKAAYAGGLKIDIDLPDRVRDPNDPNVGPHDGISIAQDWSVQDSKVGDSKAVNSTAIGGGESTETGGEER